MRYTVQVVTYHSDNLTPTATSGTVVGYKVKLYSLYESVDTFVQQKSVDWFPTKQELNCLAAIKGCLAQRSIHSRVPKKALLLRTNYQGMARLPCYRGTRVR